MTRLGSLIFCSTLATGLWGCGGNDASPKDPVDFVPLDNAVTGWTVLPQQNGSVAPMTATTKEQAEGLIDGAAAPFYKSPFTPKEFVWQNYVNSTLAAAPPDPNANPKGATVTLYIWEMSSADQTSGLYTALLQESEYAAHEWQPTSPPLGTESRIEDTNTAWFINFYKDVFYVEVFFSPSFGPKPDYTPSDPDLKAEALHFAQAVASKM